MLAEKAQHELTPRGKLLEVNIVSRFSLIENPNEVISYLCAFAATQSGHRPSSFNVNFHKVVEHDLGAHTLLDVIVDEIAAEARLYGRRLRWQGTYATDDSISRLIQSLGIIRQLKIRHEYPKPEDAIKLTVFEHRSRHYARHLRPEKLNEKGRVARKFADHINACLAKIDKELTPTARALLCSYLGEVIENAEAHANMVDWMVHGYLDASLSVPMCEIVILNFGRSFAETLSALGDGSFTRKQIEPFLAAHSSRGFFERSWRREDLLTLVALQGNVSCRNTSEDSTRGQGTADLIEFFQQVHDECKGASGLGAKMTIVSGATRVLFDGKYRMALNAHGTRVIAFNDSNDLNQKPDSAAVMPLVGAYLPGTAIGIQFPLTRDSLRDIKGADNG